MCLIRLIAETDARAVGDTRYPSFSYTIDLTAINFLTPAVGPTAHQFVKNQNHSDYERTKRKVTYGEFFLEAYW